MLSVHRLVGNRYALALGHSLVQTNGAFLQSAAVDMVMLTYPDISFTAASLHTLKAVGWQLRQASRADPYTLER